MLKSSSQLSRSEEWSDHLTTKDMMHWAWTTTLWTVRLITALVRCWSLVEGLWSNKACEQTFQYALILSEHYCSSPSARQWYQARSSELWLSWARDIATGSCLDNIMLRYNFRRCQKEVMKEANQTFCNCGTWLHSVLAFEMDLLQSKMSETECSKILPSWFLGWSMQVRRQSPYQNHWSDSAPPWGN